MNSAHRITRREWLAIIAVLLIAYAVRTVDSTRVPPGLHNDEIADAEITETFMHGRVAIFVPENIGNEALYYYFAAPFMRFIGSSVFALRLPPMFLSLIAMCTIWAFTRRLLGKTAAFVALAGFAITFWTVAFGRIILHVVMEVPLAALSAYAFWRARDAHGRRAIVLYALSGVCIGLAIDAYTAARILPFIFAAFGLYTLIARRSEWRAWLRGILIVLVGALITAVPLAFFLLQNPQNDQLGFFDIDQPLRELKQGNFQPVIETSINTLGMFTFVGDPLAYYDVPNRPVFDPLTSILLFAGVLIALRHWRNPEYAFVLLWFIIALVPGLLSQPAPNYTRTIGAQVVVFTLIGIGAASIIDRWRNKFVLAGFALLFAGNLVWTARDYFNVWPSINTVRFWHQAGLYAVANKLQSDADSSPVAICLPDYLIDEREPWWYPAYQHMHVLLHRPDLAIRYYNCVDTLILIDGSARYAFPDAVDETALQQFPIFNQFLARSATDRVELPQRLGTMLRVDRSSTPLAQVLNQVALSSTATLDADQQAARVPIDFGDKVQLLGYSLSKSSIKPGQPIDLVTYWKVIANLPPQLSQFTHVLNGQGDIVAQEDRLMLTSQSLQAGDVFIQIHHLVMPNNIKLGEYQLSIGLYTQTDGKRLPIMLNGQLHGDRASLKVIEVGK